LSSATSLFSVENGLGLYPLGYYPDVPGYVQPPGTTAIREDYYHLRGHLNEVHVTGDFILNALYHTTYLKIFGGDYAFGCLIPVGRVHVSVPVTTFVPVLQTVPSATGVPQVVVVQQPVTHRRSQTAHGLGDTFLAPFRLGWHFDTLHVQFLQGIIIPTGHFSKHHIANMGAHRWASDSNIGISWLPHTGTEISVFTGLTINRKNHKTHYHSGKELHTDFMVAQYVIPNRLRIGVAGYWYYQLTKDSGKGAVFGDFKGRLTGIGPTIGYDFELFGLPMELRSHYYKDIQRKNHLRGYSFYLTLYITIPPKPEVPEKSFGYF
jgi:hypothetical protein